jgi:high-affinity Fe2+/Pb2+ permease
MDKNIWLMGGVLVLIILLAVAAIIMRKKNKLPPDYKSFFYIGLMWMVVGLVALRENYLFFIMGAAFTMIGLSHKKDWEKNHRKWSNLDPKERKIKIALIAVLGFLLAAGIAFLLVKGK